MGYQTEVKIGGPVRLPAAAGVVAVATTGAGRGVKWDDSNANLALCADDDRIDFIVDEVHTGDNTASVLPVDASRQFRVRLDATPGTLALGKLVKIAAGGGGLFALGGGASDINVAICEEVAGANGAALVRPLAGTITT